MNAWFRKELDELEKLDLDPTTSYVLLILATAEAARREGLSYEETKTTIVSSRQFLAQATQRPPRR